MRFLLVADPSQVFDPFPLITQEQKHRLKCHKHQKIEQGKGYNIILITSFGLKMHKVGFRLLGHI